MQSQRMPVGFIGHGNPLSIADPNRTKSTRRARKLGRFPEAQPEDSATPRLRLLRAPLHARTHSAAPPTSHAPRSALACDALREIFARQGATRILRWQAVPIAAMT